MVQTANLQLNTDATNEVCPAPTSEAVLRVHHTCSILMCGCVTIVQATSLKYTVRLHVGH